MWKKMQRPGRGKDGKDGVIGRPQLLETTFNERDLAAYPDIPSHQDGTAFAQSTFAQSSNAQTLLPPRASSRAAAGTDTGRSAKVVSMAPSVSSVYSQPTPQVPYGWQEHAPLRVGQPQQPRSMARNDTNEADISPPSSAGGHEESSSRPVSPVDPNFTRPINNAKPSHPNASQIPVARKPPPAINKFAQAVAAMKSQGPIIDPSLSRAPKMRWDEYSGEPSATGKPPQIARAYSPQPPTNGSGRKPVSPEAPKTSGTRVAPRASAKGLTIETKPREEWKGASGRSAIVPVPVDRVGSKPLYRPPGERVVSPIPTPTPTATHHRQPATRAPPRDSVDEYTIKPVVPLKVGRNTPPRTIASPTSSESQRRGPVSPSSIRETSVEVPWDRQPGVAPSTPPEDTPLPRHKPTQSTGSTSSANKWQRPDATTSRFSWTTYATSTTGQQSPPPSPPPPLPTDIMLHEANMGRMPLALSSHPAYPRSPVSSTVSRKTYGAQSYGYSQSSPIRPSSPASLATKALPLPPPPSGSQSQELTTALQEQLDGLKMQKGNLQRIVRELRKDRGAMANPLLTDIRKLREAEARAKEIEEEIADLIRQEHEVGLRLHRAWKRREKESGSATSSALWIRRVTDIA